MDKRAGLRHRFDLELGSSAGYASGTYEVGVWEGSAGALSSYESYAITSFTLGVPTCSSASLAASLAPPQVVGTIVTFNAAATRCAGPQYEFWLLAPGGAWAMKQAYGSGSWSWNTSGLAPGTYQVGVWAREGGSTAAYDSYFISTFQLAG